MKATGRNIGVAASLATLLALGGCASSMPGAMGAGPSPRAAVTGPPLSTVDRDFVTRVAAKGMYEVEVSKLAAERAVSPQVRAFAQKMVQHHSQSNNELVALMSSRGVSPPRGLAADKATKLHKLAALPPSDAFDNGYIRVVGIEDHQAAIRELERARRTTKDTELRAWIDRSLAMMREHLKAAQGVAAQIAG